MSTVFLVMETILELMKRGVNGEAKIRLGELIADPQEFKTNFRRWIKGTELSHLNPEIETVPVKIKCECGYEGRVDSGNYVGAVRCPKCNREPNVLQGDEFEVLTPSEN